MTTQEPIVVIDDSLVIRRLVETILTRAGREVHAYANAADALARLGDGAQPAPSVVLLDALLPDMDGAAVHAELKRRHGAATPPVVFVSGLAREELPPADGYVHKPFTPERLLAAVAAAEEAA
ncbi:response regulator [Conexibacter sp. JD483]|uniref:response regulator n=1 Tax=unclassified Conexibacter TaxID=2627773 RepID=UPI002718D718|nr:MULTISPECIES: response regulator [unclassified Conexibacter]MDO8186629.1 response regulator [Conexibacter sp. CPCC 205706]MDO8196734.1 response regulator [Conexibacter sp. CPCC 205762]MDR9370899.1 response regulator [Conexibacter sp. JD483]